MTPGIEDFRSGGTLPSGPVSAWPKERHDQLMSAANLGGPKPAHATEVKVGIGRMAKGLVKSAAQAVTNGRVPEEIREERMNTCRNCPLFVEESKRCSDCGCFMEAKSWIGGNPKQLCPKGKWVR